MNKRNLNSNNSFGKTSLKTVDSSGSNESKIAPPASMTSLNTKEAPNLTRITINYDVGFSNALFIRGHGARLSWDKGIPLKNISPSQWVWETDVSFNKCEFKVLINDIHYEGGENHIIKNGGKITYTPSF